MTGADSAGEGVSLRVPSPPRSRVSVLIAAYHNAGTIADTLAALREQTRPPHQVVVVASGDDDTAAVVRARFPEVDLIESARRLYPGAARNRGLGRVTGDVVACLDADCVPDADWTLRIAEAIESGLDAVGGAVLNALDSDDLGWAYYLSEFSPWLPGRPRAIRDTPTCNAAYRAGLIEAVGGFTEEPLLSADSLLHWSLRRRLRIRLHFDPSMRVRHRYRGTARGLLARRFEHGRSLAEARRLLRPGYLPERLAWALAGALVLPPFYVLRLLAQALGHPDVPTRVLLRTLPLTTAGLTLWAWGQAEGAVRAGRAA